MSSISSSTTVNATTSEPMIKGELLLRLRRFYNCLNFFLKFEIGSVSMVIQTTEESGEVAVIADSSKSSTPPPVENALSDKVAKDEQEHHISVDSSSTTSSSSSHNSPCSLTKFITYSRDDLIEISKLPASKARPIQLSSGAIDE